MQHTFKVGGNKDLQLSLNVLNLFNQSTVLGRHSTYQRDNGVVPNEALFYAGT